MNQPGGPQDDGTTRNMILAVVISLLIFLPYNFFVLEPMQKKQRAAAVAERAEVQKQREEGPPANAPPSIATP